MAYKIVQLRRGTTVQNETLIGAPGEVTVDTNKWTAIVHDGVTAGGYPLKVEAMTYDRPRFLTFRAALSQQGIASLGFSAPVNGPVPIAITEDSGLITGAAVFSYQQGQSIQDHFALPYSFVPPLGLEIIWRSALVIGTVQWKIEVCGVPILAAIEGATFNTPQIIGDIPAPTTLALTETLIPDLDPTNMADLVPNGEVFFRLTRNWTDSLEGDVQLLALRFVVLVRGQ